MKKIISLILALSVVISSFVIGFTVNATNETVYYVDSIYGDDSNSGTSESSAWKTAERASQQTYSQGDKILFKAGGVYTDTFTANGSGTKDNPITISSYGDTEEYGLPLFTTEENKYLIYIHNVNGWCVENIELTAPNGKGIYVIADNEVGKMTDITIKNCTFHDVFFKQNASDGYAPIYIASYGKNAILENVTLSGLNIYDCGRGIATFGITIEWHKDIFVSPEVSYNKNFVFEDISMNNLLYDAIIITSIDGLVVRNCSLIKTALRDDWPTAPMWSHHAKNLLIENCEIAGSTNPKDSMAVDFDGWTTDSICQYIYSHDNVRFVNNCVYDDYTKNENCTVRYCLSVNDNGSDNNMAQMLSANGYPYAEDEKSKRMTNFKFYNNTIINGGDFRMQGLEGAYIANNIFYTDNILQAFQTFRFRKNDGKIIGKYTFDGIFTNNCFYGCAIPASADNSVYKDPLFTGTDFTDVNSFKLSNKSPLLGKGIQVEDDMGEYDFYGNELSDIHNIGCYDGSGEDVEVNKTVFDYIIDYLRIPVAYLVSFVKNLIEIA